MNEKNIIPLLLVLLLFSLMFNIDLFRKGVSNSQKESDINFNAPEIIKPIIETVSAKEIYPIFQCPCCGKAITECTCPMAAERMAYIDGLTSAELSEEKAIAIYVKKYGLDSFIDQEREEEFREKLVKEAPADRPIIIIQPDVYDFGDISQKKRLATTVFELKNNGRENLIINKLETSCGCTSASIVYQNEESPKFSMPGHGINEDIKDWQVSINPGEKAELKVYYDPDVHEDFRGSATREIYIFSNDPIDFEKKVTIELNQVD